MSLEVGFDLDLRELGFACDSMARAAKDLRPVWREISPTFRKAQGRHVDEQAGPDGTKWPGLAQSTVERRLRTGGVARNFTRKGAIRKPVQRKLGKVLSKKLTAALLNERSPSHFALASRAPWSFIHQGGGRAGRGAMIPARPFIYVDNVVINHLKFALYKHLHRAWSAR
jgi:phage gpG-like protein